MRRLFFGFLIVILALFCFLPPCMGAALWSNDFRKTRERAKEDGKNLFLLFTISDGGYKNMQAIQLFRYTGAFLKEARADFYFLHIDLPKNKRLSWNLASQNRRLKNRFGVSFFPSVVIVSPSSPWGGLLYRYNGLPASWQELLRDIRQKVRKPGARKPPPAVRVGNDLKKE